MSTRSRVKSIAQRLLPPRVYVPLEERWREAKEMRHTDSLFRLADPSQPLLARYLQSARRVVRPRRTVFAYPERPRVDSIAFKLFSMLGYAITTNPRRSHDIAMRCRDATFAPESDLDGFESREKVINREVNDISKEYVAEKFEEAFGYSVSVDPFTYDGLILAKSTLNGYKDGRILQGPLKETDEGVVYQKYIDADDGNGYRIDLRTLVYYDRLPLVYKKRWRIGGEHEFSVYNSPSVHDVDEVLSKDEQQKLLRFARLIGFDYGEFDVMRDNYDGRIYVVDANNTPYGPPKGLSEDEARRALFTLAPHFEYLCDQFAS